MSEFIWSNQLSIGVAPMDRDHQKIIHYMNELAVAVERKAPFAELNTAFRSLADFTRKHFKDEEMFMASINYDRLATHKTIHTKLLSELDEHYQTFNRTQQINDSIFRFLTFWLKSHICGIDKKYGALVSGERTVA